MRPILFNRLAVRLAIGLSLVLAACSNEPTVVSTPDRPGPLLAVGTDPVSGATIQTSQDDYLPGEGVRLTGAGWAPNETVTLLMTEDPATHENVTSQVVTDSAGAFSTLFYDVQAHDLGVTFTLTATGLTSGSKATAVFTDGPVILASTAPVAGVASYAITSGNGTTCSYTNSTFTTDGTISFTGGSGYPKCTEVRAPSSTVVSGTTYNFTGWSVVDLKCSGNTLTTTTGTVGANEFLQFAACGSGTTGTITAQYTAAAVNAAPVLGSIGNQSIGEGTALTFTATATDDGLPAPPALTFTLETPDGACLLLNPQVPAGATITGAGAFSWTPTESEGPRTYCARIQVSDGALSDFEDFTINVTEGNAAPVLAPIGNQSVNELVQLSLTATASDADLPANTLTFSLGTPDAGCGPTAGGAAITGAGAFTWTPTEAQGAGTYCARIQVSDGTDTDFEDIVITVAEVNVAPVLTVPANFSIKWGVALSGVNASATDADLVPPAPGTALNNLTMSLTTFPTGMTINTSPGKSGLSRAISWTPASTDVGTNSVTVKVTDDGSPAMDDSETFTINVLAHATTLTYNGATSGQYSDVSQLCATLTDDDASNAGISGKTITFYWDGSSVGTGTTNSSGKACTDLTSNVYTVLNPDGTANAHTVKAVFAGDAQYEAATDDNNAFDVDAEDATVTPDAGNLNAYQVGAPGTTATFTLVFSVMETYNSEPDANDKALAGNIGNAILNVSLIPVGGGASVTPSCTPSGGGTTYGSARLYSCLFSAVAVETYEVKADLDGTYYTGGYSDVVTVFDPSLGFVTGGGTYLMNGDRVNFGFVGKVVQNKKNSVVKGSLLVIRHKSDGQVARIKSNVFDGLAIGTNANAGSATFSGKANYSVNGVTDPTNYDFTAYVFDGGTPGAGVDKFSLFHGKASAAAGYEVRTSPTLAALKNVANVMTLTGGNIQVPQPGGK